MMTLTAIKQHVEKIKPGTESHLRKALVEGFNNVKSLNTIYETLKKEYDSTEWGTFKPLEPINAADGSLALDMFIKKSIGGYRDGTLICWDTEEGTYIYNIYENDLCLKQS